MANAAVCAGCGDFTGTGSVIHMPPGHYAGIWHSDCLTRRFAEDQKQRDAAPLHFGLVAVEAVDDAFERGRRAGMLAVIQEVEDVRAYELQRVNAYYASDIRAALERCRGMGVGGTK